jgi:O-methyltransferase
VTDRTERRPVQREVLDSDVRTHPIEFDEKLDLRLPQPRLLLGGQMQRLGGVSGSSGAKLSARHLVIIGGAAPHPYKTLHVPVRLCTVSREDRDGAGSGMGIKARAAKRVSRILRDRNISVGREYGSDLTPEMIDTIKSVRPYTMTTVQRIEAVVSATRHVVTHGIPGAFVESGVWMGGSIMAAARTLVEMGDTDRDLYLYDTFEGLPAPGEHDGIVGSEQPIDQLYANLQSASKDAFLNAPVDIVRANVARTGYPIDRIHTVQGLVQDTIPTTAPEQIAFLRLDTDWYESTKVEMETLFPRLSPGGILIVDDYGYLEGPKKAVDDFLAEYPQPVFLHRIDSSGRLAVKPNEVAR